MKGLTFLLPLLATVVAAQPPGGDKADAPAVRRLNSTLSSLKDGTSRFSVRQQLAGDMAEVADPDHRPTQKNIQQFADALTDALSAGDLRVNQISNITVPIVEVLHSAGTSTIGFYQDIDRLEQALASFGVPDRDARRVADALKTIGTQVRGPEDFPVDALPAMRSRRR